MKKNIFVLIGSFNLGGSERQAVQLSRLLHEEGTFRILVGCLDAGGILRKDVEQMAIGENPEFKLTSFYEVTDIRVILTEAGKIALEGTENYYQKLKDDEFYGGVRKYDFLYDPDTHNLLKL